MILTLLAQKGGVGKSTLSVNLAAELLREGHRVLLVDADPQGTARTWGYVAAQNSHPAPTIVTMGATMHQKGQLDRLAAGYDYVVIDTPAKFGDVQKSSLLVAHIAILPCAPSPADAWALTHSIELIKEARIYRPDLKACVVINRKRPRTVIGKSARSVLEQGGLPVLEAEIEDRISYQEALAAGQGVSAYAPADAATSEIRDFVTEVLTWPLEESNVEEANNIHAEAAPGAQ